MISLVFRYIINTYSSIENIRFSIYYKILKEKLLLNRVLIRYIITNSRVVVIDIKQYIVLDRVIDKLIIIKDKFIYSYFNL